jgi:hypothetical protein
MCYRKKLENEAMVMADDARLRQEDLDRAFNVASAKVQEVEDLHKQRTELRVTIIQKDKELRETKAKLASLEHLTNDPGSLRRQLENLEPSKKP